MAQVGINKVMLLGHVGNAPEVRQTANGVPMATFSLATNSRWKDKNTGETQEKTEWHRIVCFKQLAEIVGKYVKKGSKLHIEGSLSTRKWQDQQGADRYTTEILANELLMLDGKPDGNGFAEQPSFSNQQPSQQNQPLAVQDFDDDVPF